MSNATLQDLVGFVFGFLIFPAIIIVPGFVIGSIGNLFDFRRRSMSRKLLASLPISIAVMPIATYLLWRFFGILAVWSAYTLLWICFIFLCIRLAEWATALRLLRQSRSQRIMLVFAALWVLVAAVSLTDLEMGGGLYRSTTTIDYAKHVAVTDAISRTGLPPMNPSFFTGRPVSLYYYYFWFEQCSLVDQLGGRFVDPRAAVQAGTAWIGIALVAIVLVFVREFYPQNLTGDAELVAVGLLLVTGLDLIPFAGYYIVSFFMDHGRDLFAMEVWNEQVAAWIDAVLWTPHHVAGLIACMTGFLLLQCRPEMFNGHRAVNVFFAGCAFASAVGLSVWVALAAVFIVLGWTVVALGKRWWSEIPRFGFAGVIAALLAAPYLVDLARANQRSGLPVRVTLRVFEPVEILAKRWGVWESGWKRNGLRLASLPLSYGLEFGFFALASILFWNHRARQPAALSRNEWFVLTMVTVSLVSCSVLRSSIANNDFGWRGLMFAQFGMLLWAVPVVTSLLDRKLLPITAGLTLGGRVRPFVWVTLIFGLVATLYDLGYLRVGTQGIRGAPGLELRRAYEWVNHTTPSDAVEQHFPPLFGVEAFHALYGHRQSVLSDHAYGSLYGIDNDKYEDLRSQVLVLFEPTSEMSKIVDQCKKLRIDYLVLCSNDPGWDDPMHWRRRVEPCFQNDTVMIFRVNALPRT